MLISKKNKIKRYLAQKADCDQDVFDFLLSDYVNGVLKNDLMSMGIKKIEIHIDWLDDMKGIAIQGRYQEYYMDLQIHPDEFFVSFDLDEPDEDVIYPLQSKEQLFHVVTDTIQSLS